jgi:hypothetical protein
VYGEKAAGKTGEDRWLAASIDVLMQQYPSFRVAYMDKVKDHPIAGENGVTHSVLLRWDEDKNAPVELYRVRLPWQVEDKRGVVRILLLVSNTSCACREVRCVLALESCCVCQELSVRFRAAVARCCANRRFKTHSNECKIARSQSRRAHAGARRGQAGKPEPRDDLLLRRVPPNRRHEPGQSARGGAQDAQLAARVRAAAQRSRAWHHKRDAKGLSGRRGARRAARADRRARRLPRMDLLGQGARMLLLCFFESACVRCNLCEVGRIS